MANQIRYTAIGKIHLNAIRLNQGGYTDSGEYYGIGAPLYAAYDDGAGSDGYYETFRAADRTAAKQHVLSRIKDARFYR